MLVLVFCAISIFAQNVWDGSLSINWNSAANWSLNRVPLATDDVVIPSGGNQPVVNANAVCNNLTINSGASLAVGAFH